MFEFTSEPKKTFRPVQLAITLGIVAILLVGAVFYINYQRGRQTSPGGPIIAVAGLLEPGNANFEYYKTRIRIENVKGTLSISFKGDRTATVSGTIINDGDRTLEAVRLHVTLFDTWGKVSKEREAYAFRPGTYNYTPLMPLEKRSFIVSLEAVEYYWDQKQISLEITGLKYK
jgi:hypothetical protein